MPIKKLTLNKTQLYNQVWTKPLTQLTEQYGITYHRLKKACDELNIPTPPSGYWSKVRNDKQVDQPLLPKSQKNTHTLYFQEKVSINVDTKLPKPTEPITVKNKLRRSDQLVKHTLKQVQDEQPNKFKRVNSFGDSSLDVSINPDSLNRAMRILDAIVKALKRQGFSIKTERQGQYAKSFVLVDKVKVYFQIREKGYRKKKTGASAKEKNHWDYHPYEYFTTGKLKLVLFDSTYGSLTKTIYDSETTQIEDQLDKFFPYLLEVADKKKMQRQEIEEWHRKREKQKQLNQEAERQRKAEAERQKLLEERAEAFTTSHFITDFIAEIERQKDLRPFSKKEIQKVDAWIHWATEHANRLNSVNKTIDSILGFSSQNKD